MGLYTNSSGDASPASASRGVIAPPVVHRREAVTLSFFQNCSQLLHSSLNLLAAAESSTDGAAAEGFKLRKPQPNRYCLGVMARLPDIDWNHECWLFDA